MTNEDWNLVGAPCITHACSWTEAEATHRVWRVTWIARVSTVDQVEIDGMWMQQCIQWYEDVYGLHRELEKNPIFQILGKCHHSVIVLFGGDVLLKLDDLESRGRRPHKYTLPESKSSPWNSMDSRLVSFWEGLFSGAMLVLGRVALFCCCLLKMMFQSKTLQHTMVLPMWSRLSVWGDHPHFFCHYHLDITSNLSKSITSIRLQLWIASFSYSIHSWEVINLPYSGWLFLRTGLISYLAGL